MRASGEQALRLSEPLLKQSKAHGRCGPETSSDPDPHVRFQAALTLGELKDSRSLADSRASLRISDFGRSVVPARNPQLGGGCRIAVLSFAVAKGRNVDRPATAGRGLGDDRRTAESG